MVERAPKYRATFKSLPDRARLLGSMAPSANADITNPRELYSMLSDSRSQGTVLTSVKVGSQAGAKLPPLEISEVPYQYLKKQTRHHHHRSYPDLASFRSEAAAAAAACSQPVPVPVRRSSSLQDLHSLSLSLSLPPAETQNKKLKPILRDHKAKNTGDHYNEKAGVKFGQKEIHLIRDSPLPPIERVGAESGGKGGVSFSLPVEERDQEENWTCSHSPRQHKRAEVPSSDLFPRGQPVEVKRPVTPTYEDYPEIYWELRSATVQDPSDLKGDMIDRDRYRLQQISSLRLRAMNRDVMGNKLDTYRKWQLQMLAQSPILGIASKQDCTRRSVTPTMAGSAAPSARSGRQSRMSASLRNESLAVAATSISPNPIIKKRVENRKPSGHGTHTDRYITEDELRRRQKTDAAARGETEVEDADPKATKVTVVNLCIDPDRVTASPTSEVYTGIRRIMFGPRPLSERGRTQASTQNQEQESATTSSKPPGSASLASHNATLGSSHGHRLTSAPSAPGYSVMDGSGKGDASDVESSSTTTTTTTTTNKTILKKFNKLQVFSEKTPQQYNAQTVQAKGTTRPRATEKAPYLPQTRPQTYKLDLKNYPVHHQGGYYTERGRIGIGDGDLGTLTEGVGGYPLLADEHGALLPLGNPSPARSETASVTFRFCNGEVIVSRQGKRPNPT